MRFFKLYGSVLAGAFFIVLALTGCTAAGSSSIPEPAPTPPPQQQQLNPHRMKVQILIQLPG